MIDDDDDDVDVTRGLSAAPQTLMKINKSNDATLIAFSDRWRIAIRLGMNFSNSDEINANRSCQSKFSSIIHRSLSFQIQFWPMERISSRFILFSNRISCKNSI